jgi:phosphate transport system protein
LPGKTGISPFWPSVHLALTLLRENGIDKIKNQSEQQEENMKLVTQIPLDSRQRVFALVSAMAGMVEGAVDRAIQSLLEGDCSVAQTLLQKENAINHMEMHLDAAVLFHLSHKNLPAEENRSMACVLKINKDLERMGDLAANIARRVIEASAGWEQSNRAELQPMAIAVSHVCRKALRAVIRQDLVLAESVLDSLETVHTYRDYAFRSITERLRRDRAEINSDLPLLLASRSLDQIARHAVNLADHLVFWMSTKAQHAMAS